MHLLKRSLSAITRNSRLGMLLLLPVLGVAGAGSRASGQTAPYILPYTMSTFAGPHAQYTAGTACGAYIALDASGDGCLASVASIGADPHDIRVDGQGNVYWIDNNGSTAIIHKISAVTGRMTAYVGSTVNSTYCSAAADTQGDNCPANDGAANAGTTKNTLTPTYPYYTAKTPKSRGLAINVNGDLFYADYGGNEDHKVTAATGILSLIAGNGSANAANPPTGGPAGSSQVNGSRGIGVDPNGNVYIADTGDGVLRVIPSGIGSVPGLASSTPGSAYTLTVYNPSTVAAHVIVSGIPVSQVVLSAVEDVQCDINGNVYIADTGNNVVRVLYAGKGTIPGVANPQTGYVYVVAGYNALYSTAQNTYPTNGTSPTFPATTVQISDRKIAVDLRGNLYIADSSDQAVWFVDNTTGNIRLLAGVLGGTAGVSTGCATQTDTFGDGCPGTNAALYSASDMGTSPDNQGNLYITDAQNGVAANARLRKLLSGLNFPATAAGKSVTQNLLIHFAVADTPAALNAFGIKGTGTAYTDYTAGTPNCTLETDTTTDCIVPITFKPTQPGNDTATLTIASTLGGTNSYLLTGSGTLPAITIDPGSVSVLNSTITNAQGVAVDGAGNIYTADTGNNRVLLYTASTGVTSTFAGTGTAGYTGDAGLATAATLKAPRAVAVDSSGSVYIADTGNNVIRKVNAGGIISTFAGGGTVCSQNLNTRGDGCPALQATLSSPSGLAADNLGVIYVADTGNNVIRQIGTLGDITTLAGGATSVCSAAIDVFGDGCNGTASQFKAPTGLSFDASGSNIIVADTGDNIVRKVYLANTIVSSANTASPPQIASVVQFNPVTLIAGTGAPGDVIDTNSTGVLSQLSGPTGVAISPSGAIYIADTGNSAVRVVTPAGGISTIVGVLGASGIGTVPGSAASVQLTSPSAVAVTPTGTLQIVDAGNSRVLTDLRSQVTFNFGRTNEGFASPTQNFIESSTGVVGATLPSPLLTQSTVQTQFTLGPVTGNTGCAPGAFAIGTTCVLQAQFTPTATGSFTDTYTEVGSNVAAGDPAITLVGTGAILTKTTSVVAQTAPTGNSQFGGTATVTATITPAACNTAAPACYPTGTVRFIIDGGNPGAPITISGSGAASTGSQVIAGLAVGPHTIACNYSGDNFYAASTCGTITITVVQGGTTSVLTVTNNNQPQFNNCTGVLTNGVVVGSCGVTVLTATVTSNTIATAFPTGSVSFYSGSTLLGSSPVNATNGVASFTLQEVIGADGNAVSNNTLPPGTYTLTCTYNGSANFAVSNCSGVSFTVLPSPVTMALTARGCQLSSIVIAGTTTPTLAAPCAITNYSSAGYVQVDTAQGSTTDASIFLRPSDSFSGTVTFSCSGLPNAGACTFLPSSITFTAGTSPAVPQATDMTLWTDVPAGTNVTSIRSERHDGIAFAVLLGWPLTLAGFAGVLRFRRKLGHGILSIIAFGMLLAGSSILTSGCAGPGALVPNLTPAGTYPIVVTATGGGITASTTVSFVVGAPGIPGQE